jgi:hypothetical protein
MIEFAVEGKHRGHHPRVQTRAETLSFGGRGEGG